VGEENALHLMRWVRILINLRLIASLQDDIINDFAGLLKIDFRSGSIRFRPLEIDKGRLNKNFGSLKIDLGSLSTSIGSLEIELGWLSTSIRWREIDVGSLSTSKSSLEIDFG
jgi:hypothetical protein